ncbi:MAG: GMC family oxidoreductase, partial [Myxococcales bacterium]
MSRPLFLPEDPDGTEWDVAIVGAGMGGATLGYALARQGRRVLFLEKGRFLQRDPEVASGDLLDQGEVPEARLRKGHWPLPLEGSTSFGELDFFAPLGCGTGGSSALYAATLERMLPADFRPRANFPEVEDSSLPEAWPITYQEFEPYYRRAERLFRVRGTPDPLNPTADGCLLEPPPLAERDRCIQDLLVRRGLHPYRVHIGCELVEGCGGCGGVICQRGCKGDAGWMCLVPAVEQFGARLLPQCEVSTLEADHSRVRTLR